MTTLRRGQIVEVDTSDGERGALYRVVNPTWPSSPRHDGTPHWIVARRFKDGRWLETSRVQVSRVRRVHAGFPYRLVDRAGMLPKHRKVRNAVS